MLSSDNAETAGDAAGPRASPRGEALLSRVLTRTQTTCQRRVALPDNIDLRSWSHGQLGNEIGHRLTTPTAVKGELEKKSHKTQSYA